MTHDELIKYIDDSTDGLKHEHLFEKLLANTRALRAVVELHKPVEVSHNYYDTGLGCSAPSCHNKYDEPGYYPCETIQAIEKELAHSTES